MIAAAPLEAAAAWAYSSVVEHCVDIAGVASSILATPTIFPNPQYVTAGCLGLAWRDVVPSFVGAGESAEVAIPKQERDFAQGTLVFHHI